MTVRPATPADYPAIRAIQDQCPRLSRWEPDEDPAYDWVVAEDAGKVAGFLLSRTVADVEMEILSMAVAPESRRSGVGQTLLREVLRDRRKLCFLEVRESNEAARNLYKKMGFQELGRRERYYSDPPEPAIVMSILSC